MRPREIVTAGYPLIFSARPKEHFGHLATEPADRRGQLSEAKRVGKTKQFR
jgi:hypothetical protein